MNKLALLVVFVISSLRPAAAAPEAGVPSRPVRGQRVGLIHPLLDLDAGPDFKELRPFQHKMRALIARLAEEGRVASAAFYFRDLDNGPIMGYDENAPYKAASLLKVPVMLSILRAAEREPGLLERKAVVLPPYDTGVEQHFKPAAPLVPGAEATLRELLRAMIVGSDNAAARTLIATLTNAQYLEVFSDLGMSIPDIRDLDEPVTVREYATFFRILYNASYLSRENSQWALELLAESEFKRGLNAGVPRGVTVAHKFGESIGPDGLKQLHDCGIVYHERPYVLCIMARGRDLEAMADSLAELSNLAYREVTAQARTPDLVPSRDGRKRPSPAGRDR